MVGFFQILPSYIDDDDDVGVDHVPGMLAQMQQQDVPMRDNNS